MPCIVYIPHLIPPLEMAEALWRTVDAPSLKMLLARAAFTRNNDTDTDGLLCSTFGIAHQHDWPLAPLIAHHENLSAGSGYWLCATPIHLQTRRNALVLSDPASLDLSAADVDAFTATLSAHLREEKLSLHAPRPDQWFLHCDAPPLMTTTSLAGAMGRDVRAYLPQGADSARWHRILTEIQMLLHAHPANDARETRGLVPVNSVWLWGGGTLPPPVPQGTAPFATVWSNDATTRALAQHAGCPIERSPFSIALNRLKDESQFFSVDTLAALIRRGDAQAWVAGVTALERDWFSPLLAALKSRQLDELTVLSSNDTGTQRFVIRPNGLIKFWRKNKYLQ